MRTDAGQQTSYKVGDAIWVTAHARVGKTVVKNIMIRHHIHATGRRCRVVGSIFEEKSAWRSHYSEGTLAVLFVHGSVVFRLRESG